MGSGGSKVTAQDRAILDMKLQRDKLQQYQKKITVLTDRETEIARECLRSKQPEKAKLALRRKKYQESLLKKTDEQLAQLEILVNDVEFARIQKDVVYGLQQGTNVLREIHREMGGIEGVERLMGESAEAQAYQQEVSDMLANRMSNQDEDEVEDELDALEREVAGMDRLPDAPSQEIEGRETDRERRERRARERGEVRAQTERAEPILA